MSVLEARMKDLDGALDVLERGNLDEFMAIVERSSHSDFEFRSAIGSELSGSVFRGMDEIRGWFRDLLAISDVVRWEDRRYEAVGDEAFLLFCSVAMTYDFELESRSTGLRLDYPASVLCRLRDDLIASATTFRSHEGAREAASADA